MKYIDASGKACPMPVILAKKALDDGERDITVAVDNEIAVQNLTKLAKSYGIDAKTEKQDSLFLVMFGEGTQTAPSEPYKEPNQCFFFGKDRVGEGDPVLGNNLAKMMLYTLSENSVPPDTLIFMNSGVNLVTTDEEDLIKSLKTLEEKGTEILVCGTCLNFYGLTDAVKAGRISNMYEIVEKMYSSKKVITV